MAPGPTDRAGPQELAAELNATVSQELLPLASDRQPSSEVNMSEGRSSTESATVSQAMLGAASPAAQQEASHAAGPTAASGAAPAAAAHQPQYLEVYYGAAEDRSSRKDMQDRHMVVKELLPDAGEPWADSVAGVEPRGFAAVYDGHKRSESAEMAAAGMHAYLAREPAVFGASGQSARDEVFGAIKRAFERVDADILDQARRSDVTDCQFGGTTALVALRIGHVLYVAHAGDSGALLACSSYDVDFPLRLTTDHKPNRPDEHARIRDAGGTIDERNNRVISEPKQHNGRVTLLSMSRALGDLQFKAGGKDVVECTPEMRRVELQRGDSALLLATDGLWDVMADSEAVAVLSRVRAEVGTIDDQAANFAAQALVDEAIHRGTHDNVTAVVLLLSWS